MWKVVSILKAIISSGQKDGTIYSVNEEREDYSLLNLNSISKSSRETLDILVFQILT
jgi:hypothetical protein